MFAWMWRKWDPPHTAEFRWNAVDLLQRRMGPWGAQETSRQWRGKQPRVAGDGSEDRGIRGMSLAIKDKLLIREGPGRVHSAGGSSRSLRGGRVACEFLAKRRNRVGMVCEMVNK